MAVAAAVVVVAVAEKGEVWDSAMEERGTVAEERNHGGTRGFDSWRKQTMKKSRKCNNSQRCALG